MGTRDSASLQQTGHESVATVLHEVSEILHLLPHHEAELADRLLAELVLCAHRSQACSICCMDQGGDQEDIL